jgi:enamine deaminase RidA (YjgF/YER057c/UK114 family)
VSRRRQALRGHGLPEHPQPFPPAVKISNMVFSSAIGGYDPESGDLPGDIAEQARHAFGHMETVMRLAGGSLADVASVTVYLEDRADRAFINPEWETAFPDEDDRPVRHAVTKALPGGMKVQLEFVAVLAG